VSAEEAALAAIESAEAMTLANLNLIRSVKQLLPKKYQGVADPVIDLQTNIVQAEAKVAKKVTRTASAYSKKYGRAFKKVAKRYKKKNGSWKKNGFKLAQKAAHKEAKKGSTKKGQKRKTARRAYMK
jgi:hypothetical protein